MRDHLLDHIKFQVLLGKNEFLVLLQESSFPNKEEKTLLEQLEIMKADTDFN